MLITSESDSIECNNVIKCEIINSPLSISVIIQFAVTSSKTVHYFRPKSEISLLQPDCNMIPQLHRNAE